MIHKINLVVAVRTTGTYAERFVAPTRDEAISGFIAAYGRNPDRFDDGLAWFDYEFLSAWFGKVRGIKPHIEPPLTCSNDSPVKGNLDAINAAYWTSLHSQTDDLKEGL